MKNKLLILPLISMILLISPVLAVCTLDVSMLNQDPYPAVPGDYVEIVFQVTGVENPDCGIVTFTLNEQYPIYFDPGVSSSTTIGAGTFTKDFGSFFMVPYKVRIDENAIDGENPIEVSFSYGSTTTVVSEQSKQFNLQIEDMKSDFEITIKNYNPTTKTLTFEILNIGESDVEALTLEIPDQENIDVKGSFRNIVGDLDSNDYTTADFEATPSEGEIIIDVFYTDSINVRRNLKKTITFNPKYFKGRVNGESSSVRTYIIIFLVLGGVAYWYYRKRRKKKLAASHRH
tara:strand:+ start:748 stop:1611 length:864 start_codon:yes stop_codon:yes gene_type:complete